MSREIEILKRKIKELGIQIAGTDYNCEHRRLLVFAQLVLSDVLNEILLNKEVQDENKNKNS